MYSCMPRVFRPVAGYLCSSGVGTSGAVYCMDGGFDNVQTVNRSDRKQEHNFYYMISCDSLICLFLVTFHSIVLAVDCKICSPLRNLFLEWGSNPVHSHGRLLTCYQWATPLSVTVNRWLLVGWVEFDQLLCRRILCQPVTACETGFMTRMAILNIFYCILLLLISWSQVPVRTGATA